jgi:hypothetical protein
MICIRIEHDSSVKINRLVPQEADANRTLTLDSVTVASIELSIRNLDRLAKTFHEICSGLTTQILLLSGSRTFSREKKKAFIR